LFPEITSLKECYRIWTVMGGVTFGVLFSREKPKRVPRKSIPMGMVSLIMRRWFSCGIQSRQSLYLKIVQKLNLQI